MIQASFLGFGWLRPPAFAWALLGAAILMLGWWAVRARAHAVRALVADRQLARFVPDLSHNRSRARFLLAALAVVFLALAAAGPVRGFTLREVRRRGLDIVVCLDTSRSMLVRDLRPDRISRARREVRGLVDRLRGDRMALIAFAGDAREVAPLTHDPVALAALLDTVSPAENEKGGTDLGAALERALAGFDGRTGAHECIVVLTDGEDLEGRGLEVARKAGEQGVKVFVVGMGTEAGGKIPVERPGGGESFLRDGEGREVVSTMRGQGLDEIAAATGGAYLPADASAAPLEELYEKRISRLEARELQGGREFVPHDRFQWFLGLAAACAVLAAGLRERRARARASLARAPRASRGGDRPARPAKPAWARAFAPWMLLAVPQGAVPAPPPPGPQPIGPGAASVPAEPGAAAAASAPTPYSGSLRDGLVELRAALEAGSLETAAALGARLAALPRLSEGERALVAYHRGAVHERAGQSAEASAAFAACGGLAPPGALRLDAWYNDGTCVLQGAEQAFLAIPEARAARNLPPLAPPAGAPATPPAAGDEKDQDLALARGLYEASKQALALRLRADWRDVDTRANLEFAQKRLRELERIAREREEQEQEEQKPDDSPPKDKQDPQDEQKPKDEQDPQDKQDPQQGEPKQEPPKDEQEPGKEEKPEEQQAPEKGAPEDEKPPESREPAQERELSKEEVARLLDRLANIEQEAKQLQARIRATRRQPVEKDW